MLGYEGLVLFDCEDDLTGGVPLLCTAYNSPEQRVKIESESLIGGRTLLLDDDATPYISRPYVYDWSDNTCSMSFDITEDSAIAIKNWIINSRTVPINIAMINNSLTGSLLKNCFWTSISLNANENSFVTCEASFIALEREDEIGNDYITNRLGIITTGVGNFDIDFMSDTALNKNNNLNPIPYWKSILESDDLIGTNAEVMNWRITFGQIIEKYFSCLSSKTPQSPATVGIGQMTIDMDIELYIKSLSYNLNNIYTVDNLTLNINDTQLFFSDLNLNQRSMDGGSPSDITSLKLAYNVYGLSSN